MLRAGNLENINIGLSKSIICISQVFRFKEYIFTNKLKKKSYIISFPVLFVNGRKREMKIIREENVKGQENDNMYWKINPIEENVK